jgi:hypothetical protein
MLYNEAFIENSDQFVRQMGLLQKANTVENAE